MDVIDDDGDDVAEIDVHGSDVELDRVAEIRTS